MTVRRDGGGYVLDAKPAAVDVSLFRSLRRRADLLSRGSSERVQLLDWALGLWEAPALSRLSGAWVDRVRVGLDQEVLETSLSWATDQLYLGRHDLVIPRLRMVHERFPLVEPLADLLVRALHSAERDSEAVAVYLTVRRRLLQELGTEPSRGLQAVYLAILRGEDPPPAGGPRLVTPKPTTPARGGEGGSGKPTRGLAPDKPRQLPAAAMAFSGRKRELGVLDGWLEEALGPVRPSGRFAAEPNRDTEKAMMLAVVSGMPGVGKTALAVQWGHNVADRFPDGQIYLDLRGYHPGRPMTTTEALARLLRALGVPDVDKWASSADDLAALFRTRAAGRKLLIVLDNAETDDQVRQLLPGSATCAVIVTSRDSLAGLVARHGARRLNLDVLAPTEAVRLVRRLIGSAADAEPEAVVQLTQRCYWLPLALRVAAEWALSSPGRSLSDVVLALDGSPRALDLLDAAGDSLTAVREVFSWSYRLLLPETARTFRLLGVAPVGQIDVAGVAAMCEVGHAESRSHLEYLARANLVQRSPLMGYYTLHGLLRAYAAERAAESDGAGAVAAAQRRFQAHCLSICVAEADRVRAHNRIGPPAFDAPLPSRPALFDADHAQDSISAGPHPPLDTAPPRDARAGFRGPT